MPVQKMVQPSALLGNNFPHLARCPECPVCIRRYAGIGRVGGIIFGVPRDSKSCQILPGQSNASFLQEDDWNPIRIEHGHNSADQVTFLDEVDRF
jgi:hypothetical protein